MALDNKLTYDLEMELLLQMGLTTPKEFVHCQGLTPTETRSRTYSSSTFLTVFAISLFVRGFIAKSLMPAALALSASTT